MNAAKPCARLGNIGRYTTWQIASDSRTDIMALLNTIVIGFLNFIATHIVPYDDPGRFFDQRFCTFSEDIIDSLLSSTLLGSCHEALCNFGKSASRCVEEANASYRNDACGNGNSTHERQRHFADSASL